MSTSSSAARQRPDKEAISFPYPELSIRASAALSGASVDATTLEDDQRSREAAAHNAGRLEGEAHARADFISQIDDMRHSLAGALDEFMRERHEYYQRVEREVVKLALGIARKILHRESSIDPLLLAGMVRVLLESMEQSSKLSVQVNPSEVSEFRAFFARHLPDKQPEVIENSEIPSGRCTVHTELGTTEVGPEIQLKEIEQGLLDLQAAKPAVTR